MGVVLIKVNAYFVYLQMVYNAEFAKCIYKHPVYNNFVLQSNKFK